MSRWGASITRAPDTVALFADMPISVGLYFSCTFHNNHERGEKQGCATMIVLQLHRIWEYSERHAHMSCVEGSLNRRFSVSSDVQKVL